MLNRWDHVSKFTNQHGECARCARPDVIGIKRHLTKGETDVSSLRDTCSIGN